MNIRTAQLLSLVATLCILLAFRSNGDQAPSDVAREIMNTSSSHLLDELNHLSQILRDGSEAEREEHFKKARLHYKRAEMLHAYFFPGRESFINGAPVMHFETEVQVVDMEEPHGFQVLEEALFAESTPDYTKAQSEIEVITHWISQNQKDFTNVYLEDRQLFEAVREEIIRINSLGISGFDSPVLSHSLPEAHAALKSCLELIDPYFHSSPQTEKIGAETKALFAQTIQSTSSGDFHSFNRALFIRNYSDPLYGNLLDLQQANQIETRDLVYNTPQRVNYSARSIFAEDFLDPNAFSRFSYMKPSEKLVELGQKLFFDPVLSGNNKRACASCHDPKNGFADGVPKSLAMDGKGTVDRNSPTLLNASYQNNFFWDLRSEHLNDQIDHVVKSEKEFHTNYNDMIARLKQSDEYQKLFNEAYERENKAIGISSIKHALSQYIRTLNALNSPFDQYMRGETDEIDPEVLKGFNLFMGKAACGSCHFAPMFNGTVPPRFTETEGEVLGVAQTSENKTLDPDPGRYGIQTAYHNPYLKGQFKTPTVRNVSITGPYMHNGAYATLKEVMEFYNEGGGEGLGLDPLHQTLAADKLDLSDQEIQSVITFMEALTDTSRVFEIPGSLPRFPESLSWNDRKIGGEY
ncbi:cytochrome-c peroxidase [bacterium SCSIO 12741]|nr:cytochrome-c peroxidase [bacterium SCSIO 12741]